MHRNLNPDVFFLQPNILKLSMWDFGSCCPTEPTRAKVQTNLMFTSPELATFGGV